MHFESGGRHLRFVVCPDCPDCAERYRIPVAVALDLALRNHETPTALVRRLAERGVLASA